MYARSSGCVSETRARGRIVVAALLSTAAHVAVIMGVGGWQSPYFDMQSQRALEVRIVQGIPIATMAIASNDRLDGTAQAEQTAAPKFSTTDRNPLVHKPVEPMRPNQPNEASEDAVALPTLISAEPQSPPIIWPPTDYSTYYPETEVDVPPVALSPIIPRYPSGNSASVGGKVILRLMIDETGAVNQVIVVDAGPQGVFEESATDAFRSVLFKPAEKGGRLVGSQFITAITYSPYQSESQQAAEP